LANDECRRLLITGRWTDLDKVYASILRSANELSAGFRDVTVGKPMAVANRFSRWLEDVVDAGNLNAIGYIGLADIR
jgi:hypothetical protein